MMSWDIAQKYVDAFLTETKIERPSITFMGGEPFLAFQLISQVVAYVSSKYSERKVDYTIVTNGTLVHGAIQEWIKENENDVHVVLSLDGLGEMHDKNRNDSLRLIDLDFFRSLQKPVLNSVFTPETVGHLSETIIELHEQGFYVKGFIADGELWSVEHTEIIAEQLMQLITYYLEHPETSPISLLTQPLHYLTSSESVRRCGTETFSEVSVSADGRLWACHRCSPFENHGTWAIPEKYLELTNARHLLPECETCLLEKICNACPASNASIKDNHPQAETTCNIRKLLFKANAYFSLSMLASEHDYVALRHLSVKKKKMLAESSQTILEYLS